MHFGSASLQVEDEIQVWIDWEHSIGLLVATIGYGDRVPHTCKQDDDWNEADNQMHLSINLPTRGGKDRHSLPIHDWHRIFQSTCGEYNTNWTSALFLSPCMFRAF